MGLSEVFRTLGKERFEALIEAISIGGLRTYQVYDSFKIRARLTKLNRRGLRNAVPALWERIEADEDELAKELAHGVLISNLAFVAEALDLLEIPHDGNGFFDKQEGLREKLPEDWRKRLWDGFREKYSEAVVLLYINHLSWELDPSAKPFLG